MPKNKKIFAISFFVLQLLIIAGLIAYSAFFSFLFEIFGKEYKFRAKPSVYVYASTGMCHFDLEQNYWYLDNKTYIVPDGQNGVYKLSDDYYAPLDAVDYIYCKDRDGGFPWRREYRLENISLEQPYYSFEQENTYVTVKVFMGKSAVTAVYCDGIPIEEYIKNQGIF